MKYLDVIVIAMVHAILLEVLVCAQLMVATLVRAPSPHNFLLILIYCAQRVIFHVIPISF